MDEDMSFQKKICKIIVATVLFVFALCLIIDPNIINYINIDHFNIAVFLKDYPKIRIIFPYILIIISLIIIVTAFLIKSKKLIIIGSSDVYNSSSNRLNKYNIDKLILEIENCDKPVLLLALKRLYDFKIKIIDEICDRFYILIVCSLPFAVKLGYLVGDCNNNIDYIHYFRNSNKYIELSKVGCECNFSFDYIDNQSNELFVAVQSSYFINCEMLDEKFKTKNILKISSNELGIDVINNLTILDKFSNYIIDRIRDCYDKNEIIHISFATSALVAFCFGRLVSKTIDKKIICYQFNNQVKNNRPWGIIINGNENSLEEQIVCNLCKEESSIINIKE